MAEQECRTTLDEEFALFNQADQATLEAVNHITTAKPGCSLWLSGFETENAQTELHKAQQADLPAGDSTGDRGRHWGALRPGLGEWATGAGFVSLGWGRGRLSLGRLCFPADTLALLPPSNRNGSVSSKRNRRMPSLFRT